MSNNTRKSDPDWKNVSFFKVVDDLTGANSKLTVRNTVLEGNKSDLLTDNKEAVLFDHCTMTNNHWK